MIIAMIKNPAIFSPFGISVPKTMFFKVFISSFSIFYEKVVYCF